MSILFHDGGEVLASHVVHVGFVKGKVYLSDYLTNFISGIKKWSLCGSFVYLCKSI